MNCIQIPLLLLTLNAQPDFKQVFGEDHNKAVQFIQSNGTYFEMVSNRFKTDQRFLKSIIFPELIRYSQFSDLFETGALEWLYVEGGSKAADFSIGHFQMKPSFVETLEGYVSSVESLKEEYGFIILNGSGSSFRKDRIERMKQLSWQMIYLSCFAEICQHRFSKLTFSSEEDRLRFWCAAYNSGLMQDEASISSSQNKRTFPYGPKFGPENQYAYSDVAVDYFRSLKSSAQ